MNGLKDKLERVLAKFVTVRPPYSTLTTPNRSPPASESVHASNAFASPPSNSSMQDGPAKDNIVDFNVYLKMLIHELRTPLSTISMGLALLEEKYDPEIVKDLKHSIAFMETIFGKFAVIQDGNIELNRFECFSFQALFEHLQDVLHYFFLEQVMVFDYHISPAVYDWNYGDKYNIKHCLINLIKNALKYRTQGREGNITVHVTKVDATKVDATKVDATKVDATPRSPRPPLSPPPSTASAVIRTYRERKHQRVQISVSDTNDHLLPHIKEHLFETFNSTSGSGLGLHICKTIVELHGGIIEHTFLEPVGNRFTVTLPLELCEDVALHVIPEVIPKRGSVGGSNNSGSNSNGSSKKGRSTKPNMLFADDSVLNRKMMQKTFTGMKVFHKVYPTVDGQDLLHKFSSIRDVIHVVILDMQMPVLDGIAAATRLREENYTGIIFGLTGEADPAEHERFVRAGADHVFTKPMHAPQIAMMKTLLQTHGTDRPEGCVLHVVDGQLAWVPKVM